MNIFCLIQNFWNCVLFTFSRQTPNPRNWKRLAMIHVICSFFLFSYAKRRKSILGIPSSLCCYVKLGWMVCPISSYVSSFLRHNVVQQRGSQPWNRRKRYFRVGLIVSLYPMRGDYTGILFPAAILLSIYSTLYFSISQPWGTMAYASLVTSSSILLTTTFVSGK